MAVLLNINILSGTVMEDPVIVGEGDGAWGFLKLMTNYVGRTPDGGYTDVDQIIPLVADESRHVNTIRNYVKKGKALTVETYYRSWVSNGQNQHGFFIKKLTFSKANWGSENNNNNQRGGNHPGLPNN